MLKSDGRLFNWGSNDWNQLGDGTTTNRLLPVHLAAAGSGNVHVVGGGYHTLLLKDDGSVQTWGWNVRGQIGKGECSCDASWCGGTCVPQGSDQVRMLSFLIPSAVEP